MSKSKFLVFVYTRPVPEYQHREYHQPTRWDRDGDGIPNWRDRHDEHGRR